MAALLYLDDALPSHPVHSPSNGGIGIPHPPGSLTVGHPPIYLERLYYVSVRLVHLWRPRIRVHVGIRYDVSTPFKTGQRAPGRYENSSIARTRWPFGPRFAPFWLQWYKPSATGQCAGSAAYAASKGAVRLFIKSTAVVASGRRTTHPSRTHGVDPQSVRSYS